MSRLYGPCAIAPHHLRPGAHLVRVKTVFGTVLGALTEAHDQTHDGVPVIVYDLGRGDSRWAQLSRVVDVLHADPDVSRDSCRLACDRARAQYAERS
jgi:hypothetical protein